MGSRTSSTTTSPSEKHRCQLSVNLWWEGLVILQHQSQMHIQYPKPCKNQRANHVRATTSILYPASFGGSGPALRSKPDYCHYHEYCYYPCDYCCCYVLLHLISVYFYHHYYYYWSRLLLLPSTSVTLPNVWTSCKLDSQTVQQCEEGALSLATV